MRSLGSNAFVFVAVLLALSAQLIHAQWGKKERRVVKKEHNKYRFAIKEACDMKKMKYDMTLENEAKAWAERCVFAHQNKGRGENLAWSSGYKDSVKDSIKRMVKSWHDEEKDFTYGSDINFMKVGHFTQVIWAKTTKVGCYSQKCGSSGQSTYLVCFYDPPGNYMGQQPYQTTCEDKKKKNKKRKNRNRRRKVKKNKNKN